MQTSRKSPNRNPPSCAKAYPEPSDDTYQLVSMISVVLTLYMGILLKLDMSGETGYGKALMGFLLTAIQLGIVFIFVFFLANGKGKDDDEAPSTKVYKMLERKLGGCAYQSAMNKLGEELQEKKKDLEDKLETLVESGNLRPVWKKLAVALVDDTVKELKDHNPDPMTWIAWPHGTVGLRLSLGAQTPVPNPNECFA